MAMITADPQDVPKVNSFSFTPEYMAKVNEVIANYPPGRQAQRRDRRARPGAAAACGWLPRAAMDEVAAHPRDGADPRLRDRDLLYDVPAQAEGQVPAAGLHHDAVLAARLGRGDEGLPGSGRRHDLQRRRRSSASAPA